MVKGEGEGEEDRPQYSIDGGATCRSFVYAVRTQTSGAAAACHKKAYYGVVPLDAVSCRAPICAPHFCTEGQTQAWADDLEAIVMATLRSGGKSKKEMDLKATLAARSKWVYNRHIAG